MNRALNVTSILVITVFFVVFGSACSKSTDTDVSGTVATREPTKPNFENIEWTDLVPEDDLKALQSPPQYLSEIEDGSLGDILASQLKAESAIDAAIIDPESPGDGGTDTAPSSPEESRYQQALISKNVRPEYDGRNIRIAGFIVPLEIDDQQTVTTFFLVPFFGACLHMPPPPPNQILYAEYEPGLRLETLYYPFWLKGTLSTTLVENDTATAAYSINVVEITPYHDANAQDNDNMVGG